MSFDSFLTRRGFLGDPFASTNAEQEDRLADYFVPPPYFEAVLGDPGSPKSNVVFAPRGSGKTAQRLMIERRSAERDSPFLCLTYDNFEEVARAGKTLGAHQVELCRLLTVGVLAWLEADSFEASLLSEHEKQVVKIAAQRFLGGLSMGAYEEAIKSVKTLGDRVGDFWRTYGGPVAAGVALLMKKAGLDDVTISVTLEEQAKDSTSATSRYFLSQLLGVAKKLRRDSVYFLVDKVDETPATTTNAEAAHKLIFELITDLPTIELPGVAFKFFFWDQMEGFLRKNGMRADRMEVVRLQWTVSELSEMLSRRLATFSDGAISSFNELLDPEVGVDVQLLLAHLSNGSPRDVIRMARAIVTEHTRLGTEPDVIPLRTVYTGVRSFATESTMERFPQNESDFSRVTEASFTLPYISSVFKIGAPGATNKVQAWIAAGAVRQLGTSPNPGKKPLNLYGFTDLRIVLASSPAHEVELVLDQDQFECPACLVMVVSEESELDCPNCGTTIVVPGARSLLQVCRDAT